MWYEFHQNNSGGVFVTDDNKGIGPNVWVEADSTEDANDIAEGMGIYFNGVELGMDCPCCGDRWWGARNGEDAPVLNSLYCFHWGPAVYFHGKGGMLRITKDTLDSVLTDVDIPLRHDLFCYVTDGGPDMLKVWKYKHTLYGEVIHNYLLGPE